MYGWNSILLSFRCKDRNRFYEKYPHRKRLLSTILSITLVLIPMIAILPAYMFKKPLIFKSGIFSLLLVIAGRFIYSIRRYFFSAVSLIFAISVLCFGIVLQGEHLLYMWFAVIPGLAFLTLPYKDAINIVVTFLLGVFILSLKFHHHPAKIFLYYTVNLVAFILVISLGSFVLITKIDDTFEILNESSIRDPLTRAYNRRAFIKFIKEEIDRAKRYGFPLSLIMIDIDDFKRVNDTYGHVKGDMVLKEMAELIMCNIRQCDKLVRWGGEEFIVVCPHLSKEKAYLVAEKLRNLIESHDFNGIRITASFGVSEIDPEKPIENAIKLADHALYKVKKSGKNGVAVFGDGESSNLVMD
ncbi:GGDEF domain-containing protein [Desulfurobacterium indicum]|uniref:diguanylate cyclase n=1 Tax=Desulfurobacterium indicum TaxID=1914305 RepID=A0A1R1ML02_9BACT|nr:GGDEF domain-containing protein [Desulfurobacterium indicum]OMH40374.1 hypothetical protein BLW93_05455 [Desulfurobacterium indicum]